MKLIILFLALLVSGCATTGQALLATDDQVGMDYPDLFRNFHYAYVVDREIIVCTDVMRQQKNIFDNKHHLDNFTYEFSLSIEELEKIEHSDEILYFVRERYNIKRDTIKECNGYGQPPGTKSVTITNIDNSEFYKTIKDKPDLKQVDFDKIALQGNAGELLYTSYGQLLYISQGNNLIQIKTEPPITEGNAAVYFLVPFTVIYDIIVFPFRVIGGALYTHGS